MTRDEPSLSPKAKVLIVDDDEDVRDALRLLFEGEFDVVGLAADGREAIEFAEICDPDVIVLDQVMPEMTGAEAAGVLRAQHPSTRIVAFSAILDSKPEWADAFLNKERIDEVAPLIGSLLAAVTT
ncbi:MAG: response regulator [Actinobacteria bacterium]|nr:response regulator [Actinomycetota bacterium]